MNRANRGTWTLPLLLLIPFLLGGCGLSPGFNRSQISRSYQRPSFTEKINAPVLIEATVFSGGHFVLGPIVRDLTAEDLAALFTKPSFKADGSELFTLRALVSITETGLEDWALTIATTLVDSKTGTTLASHERRTAYRSLFAANLGSALNSVIGQLGGDLIATFKRREVAARLVPGATHTEAPTRPSDAAPPPAAAPTSQSAPATMAFGRYNALVIGNQAYRFLPRLTTPVADAKAIADLLRRDYGFDTVQLLTDATRGEIVRALDDLRRRLRGDDNLLIYYAGHGWLDRESDRGYWLPIDAEPDSRTNWLSNADITDTLRALRAKHAVVVADSCFSGTLTRDIAVRALGASDIARLIQKRARTALTSGGLEPVADVGAGGHSVFAKAFIDSLTENSGVVDLTSLFAAVRRRVLLNAEQTPRYSDIRQAGHDGGDFLFVRSR